MEILFFWVAAIIVAGQIGKAKGREGLGYALGVLLGWIGVIIILCFSKTIEKQAFDIRTIQDINRPNTYTSTPGWYDDPYKTYRLRYFDGKNWTNHTSL